MDKQTAQEYVTALTRYFTTRHNTAPEFTIHGHAHEELPEGYWVVTAEGWYDKDGRTWVNCVPSTEKAPKYLSSIATVERINNVSIAISAK